MKDAADSLRTIRSKRLVAVFAILGAASLVLSAVLLWAWWDQRGFMARARTTVGSLGQVLEVTARQRGAANVTYEVQYTYAIDGKTYRGSETVDRQPGPGNLSVFYDPADPTRSALEPSDALFGLLVGSVACAVGIGLAWGALHQRRILRAG